MSAAAELERVAELCERLDLAADRGDLADEVHAYRPGLECMIPPSAKMVVAVR